MRWYAGFCFLIAVLVWPGSELINAIDPRPPVPAGVLLVAFSLYLLCAVLLILSRRTAD